VALERWERFAPLTGIAAVVFWVLAVVIVESGDTPGDDALATEMVRYFDAEETSIYLGGFALFIGSLLFVWFAGSLRAEVAAAEGGVSRMASIVFGAAVAKAIFDISTFAPQISGGFAANESDAPLTPGAAQALWTAGDGFFIAASYAAALFLVATAVAILRWRVLPRWLAPINLLIALVLLIPPIGWAALIFAFPLWVILVSVLLYRRGGTPAPAREAAV
jgi:hypothetical protein